MEIERVREREMKINMLIDKERARETDETEMDDNDSVIDRQRIEREKARERERDRQIDRERGRKREREKERGGRKGDKQIDR